MRSTLLISWLSAITLARALPQSSISSSTTSNTGGSSSSNLVSNSASNSVTSDNVNNVNNVNSGNIINTVSTSGSSGSSSSISTTTNNGNTDVSAYISVRGSNGPYLAVDSITPLLQTPLVPTVTLIQQLAAGLPKNQNAFISPINGTSGNISFILAVGPQNTPVGNDFLSDALYQLADFFGNRARYAFQAKLKIVNNRGQPVGQELAIGNITLRQ